MSGWIYFWSLFLFVYGDLVARQRKKKEKRKKRPGDLLEEHGILFLTDGVRESAEQKAAFNYNEWWMTALISECELSVTPRVPGSDAFY